MKMYMKKTHFILTFTLYNTYLIYIYTLYCVLFLQCLFLTRTRNSIIYSAYRTAMERKILTIIEAL